MEEDDDVPTLSAETFAALQEFYSEQQKRQEIFNKLEADDKLKENILFDENWNVTVPLKDNLKILSIDVRSELNHKNYIVYWCIGLASRELEVLNKQLSQFWYDESTVQSLVKVIDRSIVDGGRVALISCPTLFVPLKRQIGHRATVTLLEYDNRFEVYRPDFIFYDYNSPLKLPPDICNSYDLVVADPPFLSEECISKTSETIKLLAKDKMVVCTGSIMGESVKKLLDLKLCIFQPHHRNNLANEFSCYANFDLDYILK